MTNYDDPITISNGMDVFGSDGEKVGTVEDMRGDTVVVSKGWFFPSEHFIPTSAINTVDGDRIYLTVTKDEALNQGWDVEPVVDETMAESTTIIDAGLPLQNPVPVADETTTAGAIAGAGSGWTTTADDVVTVDDGVESVMVEDEVASFQPEQAATGFADRDIAAATAPAEDAVETDDTITIPVVDEELTATTHEVERGDVQVERVVTTEDQSIDVPVREEHVTVSRRIVDRDADAGDAPFEELTINVSLYGEEVDVEKHAHVREEIEVAKVATTETQHVTDTVRHQDVRVVDADGNEIDEETASV